MKSLLLGVRVLTLRLPVYFMRASLTSPGAHAYQYFEPMFLTLEPGLASRKKPCLYPRQHSPVTPIYTVLAALTWAAPHRPQALLTCTTSITTVISPCKNGGSVCPSHSASPTHSSGPLHGRDRNLTGSQEPLRPLPLLMSSTVKRLVQHPVVTETK